MRDFATGDILFKLNSNHAVTSIGQADYRGNGTNDLVMCTMIGEGRKTADFQDLPKFFKILIDDIFHSEGI